MARSLERAAAARPLCDVHLDVVMHDSAMPHPATPRSGTHAVSRPVMASAKAYWILRVGAALCFIGHGAFGFITKAAWVPYFGVVGIAEPWAWRLMPWVGAVDVMAGMAVLFAPLAAMLIRRGMTSVTGGG